MDKMTTNFINRLFSLSLFIISNISLYYINFANTICNIIDTNFMAYVITNQYLSDKFYRIMIDINTSKHSIAGYEQFKTYTRDIKNILINTLR